MSYQRRIDLLFAATARAGSMARGVRRSGSAVAVALVAGGVVHGTVGNHPVAWAPSGELDHQASWSVEPSLKNEPGRERAPQEESGKGANRRSQFGGARAESSARSLSQEQQNIARFIAQQYRVTLERTSEFVDHAYRAAREVKLDPLLVLAVMSVESSFNPRAQSHAGAHGLMQVLTRVHVEKFVPFGGIPAAFDPAVNIRVGSAILKEYLQREGSVEGALKSYVGAAFLSHDGGYGMKVLNARARIAASAEGKPIPPAISFVSARAVARRSAQSETETTPQAETLQVHAASSSEVDAVVPELGASNSPVAPSAAPSASSETDGSEKSAMAL